MINMNKQTIIGISICAGILILLASFTSVVGYNTIQPKLVDSPLYAIRTSKANKGETQTIDCKYVGEGKEIPIQIPTRDSKMGLMAKAVRIIKQMDATEIEELKLKLEKIYDIGYFEDYNDLPKLDTSYPTFCTSLPICLILTIILSTGWIIWVSIVVLVFGLIEFLTLGYTCID